MSCVKFNFSKRHDGMWVSSIEVPKDQLREFKQWFKRHVPKAKVYILKTATIHVNGHITDKLPGYISIPNIDDATKLQILLRWS